MFESPIVLTAFITGGISSALLLIAAIKVGSILEYFKKDKIKKFGQGVTKSSHEAEKSACWQYLDNGDCPECEKWHEDAILPLSGFMVNENITCSKCNTVFKVISNQKAYIVKKPPRKQLKFFTKVQT